MQGDTAQGNTTQSNITQGNIAQNSESDMHGGSETTAQTARADSESIMQNARTDGTNGAHTPHAERRAYTCSCRVCDYIPKKTYIEVE